VEPFRLLSAREVREMEPLVPAAGLTGGAVFPEVHMHSSERMTLSFVQGAAERGACVANRLEVTGFLGDEKRVTGVRARDLESGDDLEIRARLVANVGGPWAVDLLARRNGAGPAHTMQHSKGCHVVVGPLTNGRALALATRQENESLVNRGGRHIFLIPWRGKTLIGTTNVPFAGPPDDVGVTEQDIADFVDEIRTAVPDANLRRDQVEWAFGGLYPLVDTEVREGVYQGSGEYRIWDHRETEGVDGLVTVLGAKFTTALRLAEKAVDRFFRRDGEAAPRCRTGETPVPGGDVPSREEAEAAVRAAAPALDAERVFELAATHGSRAVDIARRIGDDPGAGERVSPARPTVRAAVEEAARSEMALRLSDVVFRRTGLGTIGHPGAECLRTCAAILAAERGWTPERTEREVEEVEARFRGIA
jgi:glycerol-3-phosphate dehydrogenase